MSGHSKFANIKHKKEKNDAAKGKIFTIIGREIVIAVKEGGPDPANNSKLRDVIAKAKANNMPNDTIERGIKKASGEGSTVNYEYCTYEGYGPNGVAVIVEALTDNADALTLVVNALVGKIAEINEKGLISFVIDILPGVLYFLAGNNLATAVRNLLQPVYVILETIDPIYALNLNELINGLTKDLGITIDLGDLSFEAIFDILGAVVALDLTELEEIIDDVCEVIAPVDYTSASSLIGEKGKKGAYGEFFDAADLLTVLVSFALSWVQEGNNANDIVALIAGDDAEKAAEIQKYITGAIAIIVGSEGKGVGRLVKENADVVVSIPMKGKINSLNASVAASILMFEASKTRK